MIYFDEPTSGLDYDSMVRVSRLIEQLSASGVIVFVVSPTTSSLSSGPVRRWSSWTTRGRSKPPAHAADVESSVGTVFSLMGG